LTQGVTVNRMKPLQTVLIAAAVAIVASYATVKATEMNAVTPKREETVFQHVVKTRVLRCGYITYDPYLMKDANTGKLSGIFYDLTERMGKVLNLKIDWAYETSFATFQEDIKQGRFDMFCAGLWPESAKAENMLYTDPVNYVGLGIYVRQDDDRFNDGYAKLNDPAYTFSALDGEMSQLIRQEDFPQSKELAHAQMTDASTLLLDVVNKKADAVIVEKAVVGSFLKTNPNSLKDLTQGRLIRVYPNTWGAKQGEHDLVSMLNVAIHEMLNTGYVAKVVKMHEKTPGSFQPVADPYKQGE